MADSEDRTQAPSERRRLRAREEGQAPLSRELVSAAGLAGAALILGMGGPTMMHALVRQLSDMLAQSGGLPGDGLQAAGRAWVSAALPLMAGIGLAGCAAVLLQTGFLVHGRAVMPDPGRLDPRRGLKRLLGLDNGIEVLKSLAKLGVLAWAAFTAAAAFWPDANTALLWMPETLANRLGGGILHIVLLVLAAQAGIAMLDTGWIRWRFTQRLRMSAEELKQESREAEGDPKIKGRLRQLRLARSRRRMMAAVARATVVVTNPTHFAVALAYERGGGAAPRVVAKGADEVAARIRAAAVEAGVPLVANPPLARALYTVRLDAEVPPEHFQLVAEIIAYVWRLRGMAASR